MWPLKYLCIFYFFLLFAFTIQHTFFCEQATSELKQLWPPSQQKHNLTMKGVKSDIWKNLLHGYVGNEQTAMWDMILGFLYSLTVVINWTICEMVVFNQFKVLFVQIIMNKICSQSPDHWEWTIFLPSRRNSAVREGNWRKGTVWGYPVPSLCRKRYQSPQCLSRALLGHVILTVTFGLKQRFTTGSNINSCLHNSPK